MFAPTALLSLLSFMTVLTLLRYFLFAMAQMRRINTTVYACGRTGERPGNCHVAPINPDADHLGSEESEHYWRMLLQHYRALAGAPQFTASFPPSLVNNNFALLHSPHSSFTRCYKKAPVRSSQLPPQAPSAALQPTVHA